MTHGAPLSIVDPERKVVGGDGQDAAYRSLTLGFNRSQKSLRDSADLGMAFLFVFLLLVAARFADLDSDFASSMRLTSVMRQAIGLPAAASAVNDGTKGEKFILVAERDNGQRLIAKTTLERYGYAVRLTDDASQAVALFRKAAPHVSLVLLDREDLRSSTGSVIQQFKRIRPNVRILVFQSGDEQFPAGVTRMTGPLSATPLTKIVRSVLASN